MQYSRLRFFHRSDEVDGSLLLHGQLVCMYDTMYGEASAFSNQQAALDEPSRESVKKVPRVTICKLPVALNT